jgi:hypothetical protein
LELKHTCRDILFFLHTGGRENCKCIITEEFEVVVGPAVEGHLQVLRQVDQVHGQPADDKHEQHGKKNSASISEVIIKEYY